MVESIKWYRVVEPTKEHRMKLRLYTVHKDIAEQALAHYSLSARVEEIEPKKGEDWHQLVIKGTDQEKR